MPRTQPPYPPEFRREAIRLLRGGERSPRHFAAELGCSQQTLRNWLRQDEADRGAPNQLCATSSASRPGRFESLPRSSHSQAKSRATRRQRRLALFPLSPVRCRFRSDIRLTRLRFAGPWDSTRRSPSGTACRPAIGTTEGQAHRRWQASGVGTCPTLVAWSSNPIRQR
jgi:transposase-like protein